MKKIDINGGSPVELCEANQPVGATWGIDNTIVFADLNRIMRISSNGGISEEIVRGEDERFFCPQILPNGKSVLFTFKAASGFHIAVQSLKSGERKNLFEGGFAQYLPTGHLVYTIENDLFAAPFDLDTLNVSCGSIPMDEDVFRYMASRPTLSDISDSGTLVYIPTVFGFQAERTLVWVNRQGKEELISASPKGYHDPRISPDGTKVALTVFVGENSDIWIWDLERENPTRLTLNENSDVPLWTPDGKRIAYYSHSKDEEGVYWKSVDGSEDKEHLGSLPDGTMLPWAWSLDGKILVTMNSLLEGMDIGSLSLEGDRKYSPLLQDQYMEGQPKISPDGKWIAYTSDEEGQGEIFVRPFPDVDSGGKWKVSINGGDSPLWSPDGRELFYLSKNSVIAVDVETEPTFKAGKPEALFQGSYVGMLSRNFHPWDISRDGKRFLMMKSATTSGNRLASGIPHKINIIVNWFEELRERVPVP